MGRFYRWWSGAAEILGALIAVVVVIIALQWCLSLNDNCRQGGFVPGGGGAEENPACDERDPIYYP